MNHVSMLGLNMKFHPETLKEIFPMANDATFAARDYFRSESASDSIKL